MKFARPIAGAALIASLAVIVVLCVATFGGSFHRTVEITLTSDRSGLVMEPGAKVKVDGVEVGRVGDIHQEANSATLHLDIDRSAVKMIPANVTAQINASTVFGAKFVQLDLPSDPVSERIQAGAVVKSSNVATEVNTVFENISNIMTGIEPDKLSATLGALAEGLRGRGQALGTTIDDANSVLSRINPQAPTIKQDFRNTGMAGEILASSADSILKIIDNATVTSQTVIDQQHDVDRILLSAIGLGNDGAQFLGDNKVGLESALSLLVPTTKLLNKYEPVLRCLPTESTKDFNGLQGFGGGNTGYSLDLDVSLLFGDETYKNPENLPINAAQGGPHGSPGCYATPSRENGIAPYLVVNTGAMLNGYGTHSPRPGNPTFMDFLYGDGASTRSGQ